jgi:hypothetical protein
MTILWSFSPMLFHQNRSPVSGDGAPLVAIGYVLEYKMRETHKGMA